jgi:hypothetical protein
MDTRKETFWLPGERESYEDGKGVLVTLEMADHEF